MDRLNKQINERTYNDYRKQVYVELARREDYVKPIIHTFPPIWIGKMSTDQYTGINLTDCLPSTKRIYGFVSYVRDYYY